MKLNFLLLAFLISTFNVLQAQWVQSNLNSNLGRSLYSDGTTIYAATSQGIYYTDTNGDPWISIGPYNDDIYCLTKIGDKIIAGSGMGNGIFLSIDNGNNWYHPPSLSNQSVYAIAKNDSYVFAGTWGGGVYRSEDEGESWEEAGLKDLGMWDLLVVDSMLYAAVPDLYSRIYYSNNNGNSWNFASLDYPASDPRGLYYFDGKLFACDMGLWVSNDYGQSWDIQYGLSFDSTGYPVNVKMFKSIAKYNNLLIASVMFESIYISADEGKNWSPFNEGLISDWTFADVEVNGDYIWALTNFFGNAYRRSLAELTTEADKIENIMVNYTLGQNFPNPFNPSTTIKYSIPISGNVEISIYDLLGRKIKDLVNEYKNSGNYEYHFYADGISSGVYFYKMQSGNFMKTKKLLILK